ncbi:MAG: F0F1 ATP synthase subunit gamma [Actinobacteria bacterium]|nr:F0F1 ATP synthase subunit gamma [Actinomycetota bacterium]
MSKARKVLSRIKSVQSTRQITKTMEMVAAAKIKRAQTRIESARPYALKMIDVLHNVSQYVGSGSHPLLEVHENIENVVIVPITSNRGLCGAFNMNILRQSEALFRKEREQGRNVSFVGVGRKGVSYLRFAGYSLLASYIEFTDNPTFTDAKLVTDRLIEMYQEGTIDKVYIVFNHFKSVMEQKPTIHQLLPIRREEIEGEADNEANKILKAKYEFEPEAELVLFELLPRYVETVVLRALMESVASEYAARRAAMKAATDNAGEMIENLTRWYNRARQAQITQEIAEIVGGANALQEA